MGLFSLLPVLGIALVFARRFETGYSTALLHSVAIVVLLLYICGLVQLLWWGALAIHLAGAGLLAWEAWLRGRGNQQLGVSTPVVVLAGLTLLFTMIHGKDLYLYYDEYSHWGVFIREMLANDQFWGADTNSMHPRYPPAAPLWQYFFNFFVEPAEGRVYIAQFVLFLAPLLVLFEKIEWRGSYAANLGWIGLLVAIGLLVVSNFSRGINSIYVDHIIGAWFAGIVLCFAFEKLSPRKALVFLLPVTVLALFKPSSEAFALAAAGMAGLILCHQSLANRRRFLPSAGLAFGAVVLAGLVSIAALQLWEWRLDGIGAPEDREAVTEIVTGVAAEEQGVGEDTGAEISRRFFEVFVGQQLSNDAVSRDFNAFSYDIRELYTEPFRLSTLGLLLVYVIWWAGLLCFVLRGKERSFWGVISVGVALVAVAYLAAVYMTYRFAMGDSGLILSSYMRYVHTIALALVVISFAPLLPSFRASDEASVRIGGRQVALRALLAAVACAGLYIVETPYLRPAFQSNVVVPLRQDLEPAVLAVRDRVGSSRVWIYLPNDRPNRFLGQLIQYLLSPTPAVVERDAAYLNQDRESILSEWSGYDFVWIAGELDAAAAGQFSAITTQPLDERLFTVSTDNGDVTRLLPATAAN